MRKSVTPDVFIIVLFGGLSELSLFFQSSIHF